MLRYLPLNPMLHSIDKRLRCYVARVLNYVAWHLSRD
jgi:hypothetical protein